MDERGKLHAIRVVVRVRPFVTDEAQRCRRCVVPDAANAAVTVTRGDTGTGRGFSFDRVLDEHSSQADVHEAVELDRLVTAVLSGYNSTIFAYGPTGTGKTHTMEGFSYQDTSTGPSAFVSEAAESNSGSFGVIPTVCTLLFDAIRAREARGEASVAVTATYVQIYREQVYDLLHSAGGGGGAPPGAPQAAFGRGGQRGGTRAGGLRLRWLPGRGFYLEDVALVSCSSAGDALAAFRAGVKNKVMAGHRLNHASSRSHALFTLNIVVTPTTGGGGGGGGGVGGREGVLRAKLTLVDLAGSERTAMTGNTGVRLAESLFINKSLFTLRKVISVLADAARDGLSEKALFVPYRDSKLTSLLQHSLGGSSITVCIACISPGDTALEETVSTLEYASMTRSITNRVNVNEDPMARELRELREMVTFLQKQLAAGGGGGGGAAHLQPCTPAFGLLQSTDGGRGPPSGADASSEVLSEDLVGDLLSREAEAAAAAAEAEAEAEARPPPPFAAEARAALEAALADLDDFVEASQKLRRHAAGLMQASAGQRDESQRLLGENAELRDTLSFLEELVAMEDGDGPGESRVEGLSGGSFAEGSAGVRGLTREGSAGGGSSGARELHTANRAVLTELLSLRQEAAALRSRLTAAEAQLAAQGARAQASRSVGAAGGGRGGVLAGSPSKAPRTGRLGDSAAAGSGTPVMLSTTGRLLGAGTLGPEALAALVGSARVAGAEPAAFADGGKSVESPFLEDSSDGSSASQLHLLMRERMALVRLFT